MTSLSSRIAAAQGPDRALDAEIMAALYPDKVPSPIVESGYGWRFDKYHWWLQTGEDQRILPKMVIPQSYTASIDAAISTAQPAMQEHVMREALKIAGANFIVGKFTETLARAICEVSMRERGL